MILGLLLLAPILMSSAQNIDNTKNFRSLNQDLDALRLWISSNIHPLNNSAKEISSRFSGPETNNLPQVQSNLQNEDREALRLWISSNIHPLNNSAKELTSRFSSLKTNNVPQVQSNLQNDDREALRLWISSNIYPLNNSAKEITSRFSGPKISSVPKVQNNLQDEDREALRLWISSNIHPLNNSAKEITSRFSGPKISSEPKVQNNLQDEDREALRLWISNNIHPLNDSAKEITSRFSFKKNNPKPVMPSPTISPVLPAESQDTQTIKDYCETPTGEEGRCVSVRLCSKEPDEAEPDFIFKEAADCHYTKPCCPLNQILQEPKPTNKLPSVCGVSNPGGYNFRTISDDVQTRSSNFSNFAEFPWMVALLTLQTSEPLKDTEYIGGGTLIHPSVVLTVAHKVKQSGPNQIKCRAGEWDTTIDTEILPHQDRDVARIVKHEHLLLRDSIFNAALLFLESPFDLAGVYHIGVACLAPDIAAPGTICYSMGWGQDLNHRYATTLKKIKLTLMDDESCTVAYRRKKMRPFFHLHPSLTCAMGEDGDDTRFGDGGSPLVCALPNYRSLKRYAVHGMVAYGIGDNAPGYYVKVPSLLDWINRIMAEANLDRGVMYP